MIEIQTNLCNECMSTVLMLTLLDPTLALVCYYSWVKTREPWEYDYSIEFHTKLRQNISYTSITIIMKSISQQTQNDIISLLEQGKSCRQIGQEIGVHYSTVSKFCLKLHFTPPKGKGGCPSKLTPTAIHHAIHIIGTGKADTAVDVCHDWFPWIRKWAQRRVRLGPAARLGPQPPGVRLELKITHG